MEKVGMIKELETYGKTYTPFSGGDKGVYVSRVLDEMSIQKLVDFVHKHSLCQMSDKDINELHCTIMFSPAGIPLGINEEVRENDLNPIPFVCAARVTHFEFWPGHDLEGYLVALLHSEALNSIHRLWKLRGCIPTFSDYKPHITMQTPFQEYKGLSRNLQMANVDMAESGMVLRLQNETVEDIKKQSLVSVIEALQT